MSDGKQLVAGDGETSMGGTTSLNTIKVEPAHGLKNVMGPVENTSVVYKL